MNGELYNKTTLFRNSEFKNQEAGSFIAERLRGNDWVIVWRFIDICRQCLYKKFIQKHITPNNISCVANILIRLPKLPHP